MKRILVVLLCLALLPLSGLAASGKVKNLNLTAQPLNIHYAFECDQEYMILTYQTSKESGKVVVASENGRFEGDIRLLSTFGSEKVQIRIKDLEQYNQGSGTVTTKKAEEPQATHQQDDSVKKTKKIKNLTMTPIDGGVHYSFDAPGHPKLTMKYKSQQQKGEITVYPQENYHYEGDWLMPYTYAKNNVYLDFHEPGRSAKLAGGKQICGYTFKQELTEPREGPLTGVTVCIDPGHQGIHKTVKEPNGPGISGYYVSAGGMAQGETTNRLESVVALEYSYLLRDELMRLGANVVMTREVEETWVSCQDRANIAYEAGADFMLRIHLNSNKKPTASGIYVYGAKSSDYAKKVATQEEYLAMAEALLKAMKEATGHELVKKTGAAALSNRYAGNNWAQMPCFLLELGYLSTVAEDLKLNHPDYQMRMVQGICQGVYDMAVMRGLIKGE